MLGGLFPIICIVIVIVGLVCAIKESKVTGIYSAFGVYGRVSAYLTLTCLFAPAAALIGTIATLIGGGTGSFFEILILIAISAVIFLFGRGSYRSMQKKCPEFLRPKLFRSLLISGLGVAFKCSLFFIGAVWTMTGPKTVVASNGQELFVLSGSVYTPDGTHVGEMDGHNTFRPNQNYPRDEY